MATKIIKQYFTLVQEGLWSICWCSVDFLIVSLVSALPSSPWLITELIIACTVTTSSSLHPHFKCLLRLLSFFRSIRRLQLWILTPCLWSQYHNAYFSEESSSFSIILWSQSRSETQKLLKELEFGRVKQRTGEVCNSFWMTQHNIISLLFML